MRSLNSRIARLENLVSDQELGQRPEFSDEALSTWSTCVDISALVASNYAGDRDLALSDFASWPADLKTRANAFTWQLRAHLSEYFDSLDFMVWQSYLSHWLDFAFEQGSTTEDLRQAEALSQAIATVTEAAQLLVIDDETQ